MAQQYNEGEYQLLKSLIADLPTTKLTERG